ncbi:MAG: hypothetical protein KF718_10485 [Polyangiaceae bacterium]|nr:hypothetical protein [Polyangiaceae bacterium]
MYLGRRSLLALSAAALVGFPRAARGQADEEAKRLIKKRDSERYEVKTPKSSIKAGCARVHVAAPTAEVLAVIQDFKNYEKFIKRFEKSKVVGRSGKSTDVYLQVPILKGAAKIWAIVRFAPVTTERGIQILRGEMVDGNVRYLDAVWKLKRIDDENSQLNLELLIVPKLPAPGSVVTGEVAYAADTAVMGSRNRAESRYQQKKKS